MSLSKINVLNFLAFPASVPLIDVRSPSEFAQAHIPGAVSIPLFSDEERKEIGTAYKQKSREDAVRIGLRAFGPRMEAIVDQVERLVSQHGEKQVRVHCWRGGMRSGAVAWLLDLYGFKVHVLAGGYKAFRQHVLYTLGQPFRLLVLGGCTGSNKTGLLHELAKKGEKVIDLEQLAGHKGSAFGNLDLITQPTQEHFENLLARELRSLSDDGKDGEIWLEAESQRIGLINIPPDFFNQMRNSPLVFLDIPFEKRLAHIVTGYGHHSKEKLINAIIRIKKKLGGLETKTAVNALLEDDTETCFAILLKYYDKLYLRSSGNPQSERKVIHVDADTTETDINIKLVLDHVYAR